MNEFLHQHGYDDVESLEEDINHKRTELALLKDQRSFVLSRKIQFELDSAQEILSRFQCLTIGQSSKRTPTKMQSEGQCSNSSHYGQNDEVSTVSQEKQDQVDDDSSMKNELQMKNTKVKLCRFGASCSKKNKGCKFSHDQSVPADEEASIIRRQQTQVKLCRFGASCSKKDKGCEFSHDKSVPKQDVVKKDNFSHHREHPPQPQRICNDAINSGKPSIKNGTTRKQTKPRQADQKDSSSIGEPTENVRDDISVLTSDSTPFCPMGKSCDDFFCLLQHPQSRPKKCQYTEECVSYNCNKLHPATRELCSIECKVFECDKVHPSNRTRCCFSQAKCRNGECNYLHPADRENELCSEDSECTDYYCKKLHPRKRKSPCLRGIDCLNANCKFLHPPDCSLGELCEDLECTLRHPAKRPKPCKFGILCAKEQCEGLHPSDWDPSCVSRGVRLKSFQQRMEERQVTIENENGQLELRPKLPIFAQRDAFLQRLRDEKVLIVTAETGSGKTTQLPQYCAESFGGLVVCTQPRVLAAMSIADRIAEEFDGSSVGHNVGCYVKGSSGKTGKKIVLMTDAALVRRAQSDPSLSDIGVLIIDEAHERSLNTDIVLGIAKQIREKRPNDFYVVIASATIDPAKFLEFFSPHPQDFNGGALKVSGRTFPVHLAPPVLVEDKYVDVLKELLISTVVSSLKQNEDGHCLVFLPGSAEIDRAIRQFQQHEDYQTDWEPFPLYGGMPPEEQQRIFDYPSDGLNGSKRMIVFCTNVAETSLTVPNVRLVIDSGLAKEARFDPQRRMTVLEQVLISRSSAKQRMGRAGRMCEGSCVQLFDINALERENIEPEIMRSSLDMVVLQLSKLGRDFAPMLFPFMDRPSEANLRASIEILKDLGCLSTSGDITSQGNLFIDLNFDPRLSKFVLDMQELGHGDLGVEIASILSAPGSVHFMGGSDKTAKQKKQLKIAEQTLTQDSDLLYLHSAYVRWRDAGAVANKQCITCSRKASFTGCTRCRSSVAREDSLNNKVCEAICRTTTDVSALLSNYLRTAEKSVPVSSAAISAHDAIGSALVMNFKEQLCEMLLTQRPDIGAFMLGSRLKGRFTDQSCMANNLKLSCSFVLAMSAMQIPSGQLMLSSCHPVKEEILPLEFKEHLEEKSLNMTLCFKKSNLHYRFMDAVQKFVDTLAEGESSAPATANFHHFVVCSHDRADQNTLFVFAPRNIAEVVAARVSEYVDGRIQQDLESSTVIAVAAGTATVRISAGAKFDRIDQVGGSLRVKIPRLPVEVETTESCREWICKLANVGSADIEWLKFFPDNSEKQRKACATITCKTEEATKKVVESVRQFEELNNSGDTAGRSVMQDFSLADEWGRRLTAKVPGHVENYEALQISFGQQLPNPAKYNINCSKVQFTVELKNLPPSFNEVAVQRAFKDKSPDSVKFSPVKTLFVKVFKANGKFDKVSYSAKMAFCSFSSQQDIAPAIESVSQYFAQPLIYMQNDGVYNGGYITPAVPVPVPVEVAYQAPKNLISFLDITYSTAEDATAAINFLRSRNCEASGKAVVEIEFPHLFELEELLQDAITRFHVKAEREDKTKNKNGSRQRIVISSPDLAACNAAAQRIASQTTPIVLRLNDRQQQRLFTELEESGQLKAWAQQLGLTHKTQGNRFRGKRQNDAASSLLAGFSLHGPPIAQGRFMRQVADYGQKFSERYQLLAMGKEASHFRRNRPGFAKLDELDKELGEKGVISFLPHLQSIEVVMGAQQRKQDLTNTVANVHALLRSFGTNEKSAKKLLDATICGFCNEPCSSSLSICGHSACPSCLVEAAQNAALPICCPNAKCGTKVSVRDLRGALDDDQLVKLCTRSARSALKSQTRHPLAFCPNLACEAVHLRSAGYITCQQCNQSVCTQCGALNADMHRGLTCQRYKEIQDSLQSGGVEKYLSLLYDQADIFLKKNWVSSGLGDIVHVARNPALLSAAPSAQRYINGAISLGDFATVITHRGFFAWHGTPSNEAIVGICHNGFDPKRRNGQLCGPGEYFGCSAQVSHGYAGGTSRMLVCHILRASCVTDRPGFCHVVNNPMDWSLSYCIPVLVVDYGKGQRLSPVAFTVHRTASAFSGSASRRCLASDLDEYCSDDEQSAADNDVDGIHFRWHWQSDDGQFNPYADDVNAMIELKYSCFTRSDNSTHAFTTRPITRFIDDQPQRYHIDFVRSRQVNAATGYTRSLMRERKKELIAGHRAVWEFCNEFGKWRPLDALCQDAAETHFERYLGGAGPAVVANVRFPGRPEHYTMCFISPMKQTNQSSGTERKLRRVNARERLARAEHESDTVAMDVAFAPQHAVDVDAIVEFLRKDTSSTAQTALGVYWDEWDSPFLDMQRKPGKKNVFRLTATFVGLTKSLAGLLTGRIQTILATRFQANEASFHEDTDDEKAPQNPRLRMLANSTLPSGLNLSDRNNAALFIAHTLIWQFGCSIYGGFVRDWAMRGETVNDVDAKIPSDKTLEQMASDVPKKLTASNPNIVGSLQLVEGKQKGAAFTLTFSGPWAGSNIDLDFITDSSVFPAPGSDCDVDNFAINGLGELVKKAPAAGGKLIPLIVQVQHCENKQFVFFYDARKNPTVAQKRLHKLLHRGWECIGFCSLTGKDGADYQELSRLVNNKFHKQLNPQLKFCLPWDDCTET